MLSSVVVEEEEVLSHITGKWMSPFALREALKRAGVNIFPAEYSHKYVPVPGKVSARGVSCWFFPLFHSGHPFLHWDLLCCQLSQGTLPKASSSTAVTQGKRVRCTLSDLSFCPAGCPGRSEGLWTDGSACSCFCFCSQQVEWRSRARASRVQGLWSQTKLQSRPALTPPQLDRNN